MKKSIKYLVVIIVLAYIFRIPGMIAYLISDVSTLDIDNELSNIETILFIVSLIIFIVLLIRYFLNRNINRAYRIKVSEVVEKAGFTKVISERVSRSDQSTINKFVKLADVILKQGGDL